MKMETVFPQVLPTHRKAWLHACFSILMTNNPFRNNTRVFKQHHMSTDKYNQHLCFIHIAKSTF